MNERTTAFEFDEALDEAVAGSKDSTADTVRKMLWFQYDDCTNHKIVASKEQWDLLNRLLLLLESDGEIEEEEKNGSWSWGVRQAIALGCLAIFGFVTAVTGFGEHLLIAAIPLGGVSMLLAKWRSRTEPELNASQTAMEPFSSLSELIAVRRRCSGFKKIRFPNAVANRRIRSPFMDALFKVPSTVLWLTLSPAVLAMQAMPERRSEPQTGIIASGVA
jgi:hypothetical protein